MDDMRIDVEEPHQPSQVISLEDAMKIYQLDDVDISLLKDGGIVWYRDIALTMHRDDEE